MKKHSKSDKGIEVVLENRIRQSFLELQENGNSSAKLGKSIQIKKMKFLETGSFVLVCKIDVL